MKRRQFLKGCIALATVGVVAPDLVPRIYCRFCRVYEPVRIEQRLDLLGMPMMARVTHRINGRTYDAAILFEPSMGWVKQFRDTITLAFDNRHRQLLGQL